MAATFLQSVVRGWLPGRDTMTFKASRKKELRISSISSSFGVVIAFRGKDAQIISSLTRFLGKAERLAAAFLQAAVRGWLARRFAK